MNNSESMPSVNADSALSATESGLFHRFGNSRMTEDYSIKEGEDEKRLGYLPHNLDVFDYPGVEGDDALHDPGPIMPRKGVDRIIVESKAFSGKTDWLSIRGWLNAIGLGILAVTLVSLFAGFPIVDYFIKHPVGTLGGFNLGGINATGQVPQILGFRGLIDADTPRSARTKKGTDGKDYQLVFSDEFNTENRTCKLFFDKSVLCHFPSIIFHQRLIFQQAAMLVISSDLLRAVDFCIHQPNYSSNKKRCNVLIFL
jgi:hypothetical protein